MGRRPIPDDVENKDVTIRGASSYQTLAPSNTNWNHTLAVAPLRRGHQGAMPPKAAPTLFEVEGVQCSINGGLVNVGLNTGWPRELRFPTRVKPTYDVCARRSVHTSSGQPAKRMPQVNILQRPPHLIHLFLTSLSHLHPPRRPVT